MALPLFYLEDLSADEIVLDEDTSRHVVQVLRKQNGEELQLTDGKGTKAVAAITNDNRKRCGVRILQRTAVPPPPQRTAVGIALVKNTSRFEWFLEKATEVGLSEIIPMVTGRTEKEKFRFDRMHSILVSAMLQSQQSWMPVLHQPLEFREVIHLPDYSQLFIAHCLEEEKNELKNAYQPASGPAIVLIGPEGDFTPQEVEEALAKGFQPVSLGQTRLRTETAGMVAAVLLKI